MVRAD